MSMHSKTPGLDFGNSKEPSTTFCIFERVIEDRGSKYSVSYGYVLGRDDIQTFLKQLKSDKKYAKATHNSWAVRLTKDAVIYESKSDDGETGAGQVILRVMQKENVTNCIICVTRWFGGIKLMGDRFKHIQDATKYAIEHME
jgi:putative IMPACT (imprinted ancient) family translation regulator